MRPIFVIGTGRCGSTMLSDVLRLHSDVLSISELFFALQPFRYRADDECAGEEFWAWLACESPLLAPLVRLGQEPDEFLYPLGSGGRYRREHGVPAIAAITLPHLTGDPDALFDEVGEMVRRYPRQGAGAHFADLFGWLAERFGKTAWVERSGGALYFTDELRRLSPAARWVHVWRDGRDTAMSNRRHPVYRLLWIHRQLQWHGIDPLHPPAPEERAQPAEVVALLRLLGDADAFRRQQVPAAWFGDLWSNMIRAGAAALRDADPSDVLVLRYELIGDHLDQVLSELCEFIGVPVERKLLRRARSVVRKPGIGAWESLPPADAQELAAACAPGARRVRLVSGARSVGV